MARKTLLVSGPSLFSACTLALALWACSQPDDEPRQCSVSAPLACPEPAPRYVDVAPIFERRCASCHNGEPREPWPLDNYDHVADWQELVRAAVLHCDMPPPDSDITLTDEERQTILAWIKCGALE
jgi:uncharacterized membrane protein